MTWDLPTDAPRFVQHGIGYSYTIARGEITVENDKFTGALPGRLVRGPPTPQLAVTLCQAQCDR